MREEKEETRRQRARGKREREEIEYEERGVSEMWALHHQCMKGFFWRVKIEHYLKGRDIVSSNLYKFEYIIVKPRFYYFLEWDL